MVHLVSSQPLDLPLSPPPCAGIPFVPTSSPRICRLLPTLLRSPLTRFYVLSHSPILFFAVFFSLESHMLPMSGCPRLQPRVLPLVSLFSSWVMPRAFLSPSAFLPVPFLCRIPLYSGPVANLIPFCSKSRRNFNPFIFGGRVPPWFLQEPLPQDEPFGFLTGNKTSFPIIGTVFPISPC